MEDFAYGYKGGRVFHVATNKEVKEAKILERVKKLRIPPAYTKVRIHKKEDAKLQAYGYDDKGRKQFIYHKDYIAKQQRRKFDTILKLGKIYQQIERDVDKTISDVIKTPSRIHEKNSIIFLILYIMLLCNFRIGNEKYSKENKHYGLTTMEWDHVRFLNAKSVTGAKSVVGAKSVEFRFVGKKGVINESVCTDERVYKFLKVLKKHRNKGDSQVFQGVSSADVNAHLKLYHPKITAKGIRLWKANQLFLDFFNQTKSVSEAIKMVAKSLHNTPAVCKTSYLHPKLVDKMKNAKQKDAKQKDAKQKDAKQKDAKQKDAKQKDAKQKNGTRKMI